MRGARAGIRGARASLLTASARIRPLQARAVASAVASAVAYAVPTLVSTPMLTPEAARQHIRIAAIVTLASGVLALFPAVILVLVAGGLLTAGTFGMGSDGGGGLLAGGIVGLVAIAFAILALPSIFAGFGLMARKPWARVLTIVLAIFALFAFPLGTILGAYQLWVFALNPETRAAYDADAARTPTYASRA